MMAVVNYSKYIKYCKISINCITSKSATLKYQNFAQFFMILYLKFACGDDVGTEKTVQGWRQKRGQGEDGNKVCGNVVGDSVVGTGWG